MESTQNSDSAAQSSSSWLNIENGKTNCVLGQTAAAANIIVNRQVSSGGLFPMLSLRENVTINNGIAHKIPEILKYLEIDGFRSGTLPSKMHDFDRYIAKIVIALCSINNRIILPLAGSPVAEKLALKILSYADTLKAEGKTIIFTTTDPQLARSRAQVYHIVAGEKVIHHGNCVDNDVSGEYAKVCVEYGKTSFPQQQRKSGAMVLEILGLQVPGFKGDISLNARRGEILGIYGLGECGMAGLYMALTARANAGKGIISLNGKNLKARVLTPADAINAGTGILPRSDFSGALSTTEELNVPIMGKVSTLGIARCVKMAQAADTANETLAKMLAGIPAELQPDAEFAQYIRRMLATEYEVFIFRNCDSTYKYVPLLRHIAGAIAAAGKAVIWFTSDLQEIFGMCDMTGVLHNGTLCPPRQTSKWTPQEVTGYANSATAGAFSIL